MKGSNEIRLNSASMVEAVQEYFDKRTLPSGKFEVKSIKKLNSMFIIDVLSAESDDGPSN